MISNAGEVNVNIPLFNVTEMVTEVKGISFEVLTTIVPLASMVIPGTGDFDFIE